MRPVNDTASVTAVSPVVDEMHYVCSCDPNVALCGTDVTHERWDETREATCVVCDDLAEADCPRCGE